MALRMSDTLTQSPLPLAANAHAAAVLERNRLATRLRRVIRGDVLFDAASRARYSLDAGGHCSEPVGVVTPRDDTDVLAVLDLARESGVAVLARGAGTSRTAQSIGPAVLLDYSKYQQQIIGFDARSGIVEVQAGITVAQLNRFAAAHGLYFPVKVSNPEAATVGGLVANDSACTPFVHAIDAILPDGTTEFFGPFGVDAQRPMGSSRTATLVSRLFELQVLGSEGVNLASVLVGSRGRLALFRRLHLKLIPVSETAAADLASLTFAPVAALGYAFAQVRAAFDPEYALLPPQELASLAETKPGQCDFMGGCRSDSGSMCPSFQVTGDELHSPRGRASTLRLAGERLDSAEVSQAMELCVSCKACKSACPANIDMARIKIDVMQAQQQHGAKLTLAANLIAYLPRYAKWARRLHTLANARNRWNWLAKIAESLLGLSAQRPWPVWQAKAFTDTVAAPVLANTEKTILLWTDTLHNNFEPQVLADACAVLQAAGYTVQLATAAPSKERPLCCGRTFLSQGMVIEARAEIIRSLNALRPWLVAGIPIIGLEPACLLSMRDEFLTLALGEEHHALAKRLASQSFLLEEFIARELEASRWQLALKPATKSAWLHGHCHQKAFGQMTTVERCLRLVPNLQVHSIDSACCGMAGSFGLEASHLRVSMRMAEATLLPTIRQAGAQDWIVTDGSSCRAQISIGSARQAHHVASVLAAHL
jgi:Fe-S oxidoreductase